MTTVDLNDHLNRNRLSGQAPPVILSDIRLDEGKPVPFARAVVNADTGEPISLVGRDYRLVTHNHLLETVESAINRLVLRESDVSRGIFFTKRGAKMRALFKFPRIQRNVTGNDTICPVVRITNSYDTTTRITIEIGAFRFVCTNFAIGGAGTFHAGFNAIHQGDIDIARIQIQIESFLDRFDQLVDTYRHWLDTPWLSVDVASLTDHLAPLGRGHLDRIPALTAPETIPNRFRAYNDFTFYGTHCLRTANAAFRFLDTVNHGFQQLEYEENRASENGSA
jgi:hypothetical protein